MGLDWMPAIDDGRMRRLRYRMDRGSRIFSSEAAMLRTRTLLDVQNRSLDGHILLIDGYL